MFYFFVLRKIIINKIRLITTIAAAAATTVVHFINISIFNLIRVRAIGRLFTKPADSGVPHYLIHSFDAKKISIKYNRVEYINMVRGVGDFFVAPQLRCCGHTWSFLGDGNNNSKYDVDVAVSV